MLFCFTVVIVGLVGFGRSGDADRPLAAFLLRTPEALERLTGIPGWAAATVGLSLFGLLVAGEGFYSDVAWHVALGRDEGLFTAPHTSIVLGLGLIFLSGLVGVGFASLQQVDTRLRWKARAHPVVDAAAAGPRRRRAARLPARRAVAPAPTASTSRCGARPTC